MQPTITLMVLSRQSLKKSIQFFLKDRALGHYLVYRKVSYLYKVMFHQLTIQLGYVQLSSYLTENLQYLMNLCHVYLYFILIWRTIALYRHVV